MLSLFKYIIIPRVTGAILHLINLFNAYFLQDYFTKGSVGSIRVVAIPNAIVKVKNTI
jgi:hypothetical protein